MLRFSPVEGPERRPVRTTGTGLGSVPDVELQEYYYKTEID